MASAPRPDVRLPTSTYERICDGVAFLSLIACVALPLAYVGSLPERIPTHFGLSGEPDRWGGKGTLVILPLLGVLPCFFLAIVRFIPPRYWNIPVSVTEANAARQYRLARDMVATLLAYMMLAMAGLIWQILESTRAERLTTGFYIALGGLLIGTTVIVFGYLIMAARRA